ncbi:hypothetical protein FHG55_17330 [Pseudomonas jessenii]|uniref:Uncharacterized protein n=2 Tax=Pseudomonas TaxID=286 RepID=A0A5C4KTK5_PSEJE|nr:MULTISPECIES: hypothetical protein [Pseudomonas]QBR29569.1 hypothetical protein E3Z29_02955 [Pseudomonas sp. S150]QBX39115.1 hypothetical protein E4T63_00425 [Pseudomonas fluorescens]TNB93488.1 hypothetical protein FHG55_17330 [Pseudomonas jessenii]UZT93061.1 hypothetical protein OPS05_00415 [Pseudomonas koreensis]
MTTQTTFVTTMNALREFHKASCDHTPGARRQVLAKPVYPTVSALTSLTPEEAAAVEGLKEDSQRNGAVNTNEIQNQITADTERFKESGGGDAASEEFRKRMEEKRAAQKESSNKMIDDMFDKAIDIGEKYPATQGAILSVSDQIMAFFSKLYNEIYFWVSNIVEQFVEWVKNALENIKNTARRIVDWISNWFK